MEETGAHIDDDTDSPLPIANNESSLWTITDATEVQQRDQQQIKSPAVSENKISDEKGKTDIPQTAKKKKSPKTRKSSLYSFFSKNSSALKERFKYHILS